MSKIIKCIECGYELIYLPDNVKYCDNCQKFCIDCGHKITLYANFCEKCGYNLLTSVCKLCYTYYYVAEDNLAKFCEHCGIVLIDSFTIPSVSPFYEKLQDQGYM